VAHILIPQIQVHEAAQLPVLLEQVLAQLGERFGQFFDGFAHGGSIHRDLRLVVRIGSQCCRDIDCRHSRFLHS
jgi:hypothetical protein